MSVAFSQKLSLYQLVYEHYQLISADPHFAYVYEWSDFILVNYRYSTNYQVSASFDQFLTASVV
jgi:hypothetical protein